MSTRFLSHHSTTKTVEVEADKAAATIVDVMKWVQIRTLTSLILCSAEHPGNFEPYKIRELIEELSDWYGIYS